MYFSTVQHKARLSPVYSGFVRMLRSSLGHKELATRWGFAKEKTQKNQPHSLCPGSTAEVGNGLSSAGIDNYPLIDWFASLKYASHSAIFLTVIILLAHCISPNKQVFLKCNNFKTQIRDLRASSILLKASHSHVLRALPRTLLETQFYETLVKTNKASKGLWLKMELKKKITHFEAIAKKKKVTWNYATKFGFARK